MKSYPSQTKKRGVVIKGINYNIEKISPLRDAKCASVCESAFLKAKFV